MQYNLLVTFVPAKKAVGVTFYFAAYSTGIRFCLLYYFRFLGTFIDLYMGHCTLLLFVVVFVQIKNSPSPSEHAGS